MNAMNRYKRKYSEWEHSGQKGDGPTKPKPLIRVHPARNSNKVFIEDMNNAIDIVDGEEMHLHMLSFDTELSNSIRLQSEAWNSKQIMELMLRQQSAPTCVQCLLELRLYRHAYGLGDQGEPA